jgi:hypothetical protein
MLKKLLFLGLISGILAGIVSVLFQQLYTHSVGADFSTIAKPAGIVISCTIGCLVASLGYWILERWTKGNTDAVFNLVFVVLSFATLLGPIKAKLPLEIDRPELFLGLTVPMHLFPVLGWLTLKPLFLSSKRTQAQSA